MTPQPHDPSSDSADPPRRTRLAAERTQLAWWRTGLTALAVAIGVGGVIPQLDTSVEKWPYTALGLGFALYGVVLFAAGSVRGHGVDEALSKGSFLRLQTWVSVGLAAAGGVLGLATALLITIN